ELARLRRRQVGAAETRSQVAGDEPLVEPVGGRAHGAHLADDLVARPSRLDHSLDAARLAFDAAKGGDQANPVGVIHRRHYTPGGMRAAPVSEPAVRGRPLAD